MSDTLVKADWFAAYLLYTTPKAQVDIYREDAISGDTVAQCMAQPALSWQKRLNVIGSGSSVDNEVSGG